MMTNKTNVVNKKIKGKGYKFVLTSVLIALSFTLTACEQEAVFNEFIDSVNIFTNEDLPSVSQDPVPQSINAQDISTINSDEIIETQIPTQTTPTQSTYDILEQSSSFLTSANGLANIDRFHLRVPIKDKLTPNVSQQFLGVNDIEQRLSESLPEIAYNTDNLSEFAQKVNNAQWNQGKALDQSMIIKIQALLTWNSHSVGAVDGAFAGNTLKALYAFQKARGIKPSSTMNVPTWHFLTASKALQNRPVLVNYTLTREDVNRPYRTGSEFKSRLEGLGEKFRMSRSMINRLNPNLKLKTGTVITVFNPGQPNNILIDRLEVYKRKNLLVAFDAEDRVVATYPTTVGTRSPSGTHKVISRVINPSYNSDGFKNRSKTLSPGPNNPVGMVWIALSKPTFGIHGSPEPEMISRQKSGGCVRLTNWDALSLYGVVKLRAQVVFKNS